MNTSSFVQAVIVAAALLAGTVAQGAPLVSASYTVGTSGAEAINSFATAGSESVTVTLSDVPWPSPAGNLSIKFEVVDGAGTIFGTMNGFGTDVLQLPTAGTYYALSFATAQAGTGLGFGTYALNVVPTAVPIPPGAPLLLVGLAIL
ncbi:MAG TPA: hypothetical protein VLV86_19525, partial [Vicinamibacterales bacterium]|nr:hypothetical protein [Vicinamibacterales bacterium]